MKRKRVNPGWGPAWPSLVAVAFFLVVVPENARAANQPPTAILSAGQTTAATGTTISFDGSGSSGADGVIVSYAWDFGDGNTATGATSTHAWSAAGTYTVTLTVTDDGGATGTDTVVITVQSRPILSPSPTSITFTAVSGGANPPPKTITVNDTNAAANPIPLAWIATQTAAQPWLALTNTSGVAGDALTLTATVGTLTPGTYSSSVVISAPSASNSPVIVAVTFTVSSPPPSITILSPAGGEAWPAGSTRFIRWTTQNLNDLNISYSADGGTNWTAIASAIDDTSPNWGNYPWVVPNAPTTQAVILIVGYFGEAPTQSGVFEITAGADTTPPSVTFTIAGLGGTVDDPAVSSLTFGGTAVPVTGGTFLGLVNLTASPTTISVSGTNAAGRITTRTVAVTP